MRRRVLILGSSEGLVYAETLKVALDERFDNQQMDFTCDLWSKNLVWKNGMTTLDSLIQYAKELKREGGYVVTLFTPDDKLELRGANYYCSRDNVWLEYGLFTGILGANKVFVVRPTEDIMISRAKAKWRLPTDFKSYAMTYQYKSKTKPGTVLNNIAIEIADRIFTNIPKTQESFAENNSNKGGFIRSY